MCWSDWRRRKKGVRTKQKSVVDLVFNVHYFLSLLKEAWTEREDTTQTVNVFRIWKGQQITGVYCTIGIIFYYILIICCFLLQVSFLLSLLVLYGWEGYRVGDYLCKTAGWVYVSMWYYFPLPVPLLPRSLKATVMPQFL